MAKKNEVYTYRSGKKLKLKKRVDQFVVRLLPGELVNSKLSDAEQMSSASSRVTCSKKELETLMKSSRKMAPTHHAYEDPETGEEFLITDRVIVTFKKPMSDEEIGIFAGKYALEIGRKYSDTQYLFRLTDETGMNPLKLVVLLTEKDKSIELAENDLNIRASRYFNLPTDSAYLRQWHLHTHSQSSEFDSRSSSRVEQAWQFLQSFGDKETVVAFADDGCRMDHEDFDSEGKFAGWGYFQGINLIRHGEAGALLDRMYEFGQDHGTACGGVIGAEVDGMMTVGAAPHCKLLPIKWESDSHFLFISDSKLLEALDYISDKADIFSNSWGFAPTKIYSSLVINKIKELSQSGGRRGKGIIFLWAAGNENSPIDYFAGQDIPYTSGWKNGSWIGVKTSRRFENNLSDLPGVLFVASISSNAKRSHYSNYGKGIDLCAPSNNIHKYHRIPVEGLGITTTSGRFANVRDNFGGTSSATPLVAGIAALVISANPQLSASEVISILKKTASKDLNMEGYPITPSASYDPNPKKWDVSPVAPFDNGDFLEKGFEEGTWSPWFGHGKVDAFAAVKESKKRSGETGQKVKVEQIANLEIPDNDPGGIVGRIFINDQGKISDLKVLVEISHTYIGDLIITLLSPNGHRVVLHNRDGGSAHDLFKNFSDANIPLLSEIKGEEIRGPWTLEVSDNAAVDRGVLKRWGLEAEIISEVSPIRMESSPGIKIPDNDPSGIEDTITVPDSRLVSDISVEVDITHTWIGDLKISLLHFNGDTSEVILHGREGRDAHDIQATYKISDEPELQKFIGRGANGDWKLKVSDNAGQDIGKLNRWALNIK